MSTTAAARHRETTALLGMVIFIASWAMLFAGLFFAYGVVRARSLAWPPLDLPRLPRGIPAAATLLLALSSGCLQGGLSRVRNGAQGLPARIAGAALLGAGFLALQTVVWRQLWMAGLRPESGTYASVFYGLTVFHALHVAVGLVALGVLALAALRGRFTAEAHVPVRLWTIYWHMVGVLWAVMFAVVYLL